MTVVIPRQRGDAVTRPQVPGLHGAGQLPRPRKTVAVGVAVARIVPRDRDDLLVSMHPLGVSHDRCDRQWDIHHQTIHGRLFSFVFERGMYRFAVGFSNPESRQLSSNQRPVVDTLNSRFQGSPFALELDQMRQQRQLGPLVHSRVHIVINGSDQAVQ
ncbi:MAG: Uncharacterised protein [Halieaceae bacterium]|nr:MAG: Uncharacterised protein [Halieaceae bacterium]